jgi:hypothetical protein
LQLANSSTKNYEAATTSSTSKDNYPNKRILTTNHYYTPTTIR